ncbi:glycosyltransferase family 2 protein [Luteimonas sp. RIT-PG2_3]
MTMTTIWTLVFWLSAALVVHAFAGYPLWVRLLAKLRPRPVVVRDYLPTVTAIMSVYNAREQALQKLHNLRALAYPTGLLDIIVVCDGCSDGTAQVIADAGLPGVRVIDSPQRRGKSQCLDDAVALAEGELLLMVDVRQRLEPGVLRALVANLSDPAVGAVSGELLFEDADSGFAASVDAYWRYEKMIRLAESRSGSVVGVTGACYAMRRALYRPLPPGTVLDDVLVPMQVVKAGSRVLFEPAAIAWDRASTDSTREGVRKVRTLAGNYQLLALAPWLIDPFANPLWARFVSHKLLRLAVPWLLCTLLLATVLLAPRHPFYLACLVAAIAAVLLVLVATSVPAVAALKPVRLLLAFWHMNLYAARALLAYLRNPGLHLW